MATTTDTNIYERFNVTFDQVQAAERLISDTTRRVYYRVASAHNPVEYTVQYNYEVKALTCNCLAGLNGRNCWHRRAAQAHAEEYRANRKALQEKEEAQAVEEIAAEVAEDKLNRLQAEKAERKAVKANGRRAYERPPFQFMR